MKKTLLVVALATSFAGTAMAAEDKRVYGGVEYGISKVEDNTRAMATTFVSVLGGSATATQDANVGIGRIFAGYRLTPQAAIEGGYFVSNAIKYRVSGVTSGSAAYTASADVEYDGFDLSAVWTPMAQKYGDTGFFLKAGVHSSSVDATVSITGASGSVSSSISESGTGMLFGAGYDLKFGSDAFVRFAATRYTSIAGDSDNKGTVWSMAIGTNF